MKIKDILLVFSQLGKVLLIGVALIAAMLIVVIGFQWIWNAVPLGLAALTLGFSILAGTFYYSRGTAAFASGVGFSERVSLIAAPQILGLLFGITCLISGAAWFITPAPLINSLPRFSTGVWYLIFGIMLLYGTGEIIKLAVMSLRVYWLGSIFFFVISAIVFLFTNAALWRMPDSLPADYVVAGKAVAGFLILLQVAYLFFIKAVPAFGKKDKEPIEDK